MTDLPRTLFVATTRGPTAWYRIALPAERLGADQLPFPVKLVDEELPLPTKAPIVGEHSEEVLHSVLGYDDDRIAALREAGALGPT